jgi:hypothetical protein
MAGVASFLTTALIGALFMRVVPASLRGRIRPIVADAAQVPLSTVGKGDDDRYLAYCRGGVEDYMIYHDLGGAADALRRADVLFLGNSRAQHAFKDQRLLSDFFAKRGLSYFVLAFGYGEGSAFPEAIIRKYDLHPKWVIVNADPFFGKPESALASKVMSSGPFDGFKFRLETVAAFEVRNRLHRVLPYVALGQWDDQADWVYYRSRRDGTIALASYKGSPSATIPAGEQTLTPDQSAVAGRFRDDLQHRGGRLVLTCVPPAPAASATSLARALGTPLIVPELTNLVTIDGSHLTDDCARRFCSAVLEKLAPVMAKVGRLPSASETKD